MNTFKKLFCVTLIALIGLFSACSNQEQDADKMTVTIEQTPEGIVDIALKNLLGNNFRDVSYFGRFDDNNVGGKLFYNAIFKNMQYNILSTTENSDDTYTVDVEITNYNLSEIPSIDELKNMEEYNELTTFELQNLVINTIDELESTVTQNIGVVLVKGAKGFNITNKGELYKAASGGYLGKW